MKSKGSTTARSTADPASIYQLKVTLRDTDPAIWRRLLVPGEVSFRDFHQVLQVAMGWENDHLYEFKVGKRYFGEPEPKSWTVLIPNRTEDAGAVRLSGIAPRTRTAFTYLYDMGDSWSHEVKVERCSGGNQRPGTHYASAGSACARLKTAVESGATPISDGAGGSGRPQVCRASRLGGPLRPGEIRSRCGQRPPCQARGPSTSVAQHLTATEVQPRSRQPLAEVAGRGRAESFQGTLETSDPHADCLLAPRISTGMGQ